jgi:hypothetical protein
MLGCLYQGFELVMLAAQREPYQELDKQLPENIQLYQDTSVLLQKLLCIVGGGGDFSAQKLTVICLNLELGH